MTLVFVWLCYSTWDLDLVVFGKLKFREVGNGVVGSKKENADIIWSDAQDRSAKRIGLSAFLLRNVFLRIQQQALGCIEVSFLARGDFTGKGCSTLEAPEFQPAAAANFFH